MREDNELRIEQPKTSNRKQAIVLLCLFGSPGLFLLIASLVTTAWAFWGANYPAVVEAVGITWDSGSDHRHAYAKAVYKYTLHGQQKRGEARISWDLYDRWNNARPTAPGAPVANTTVRAWGRWPFFYDNINQPGGTGTYQIVFFWSFALLWNGAVFFMLKKTWQDKPRRRKNTNQR